MENNLGQNAPSVPHNMHEAQKVNKPQFNIEMQEDNFKQHSPELGLDEKGFNEFLDKPHQNAEYRVSDNEENHGIIGPVETNTRMNVKDAFTPNNPIERTSIGQSYPARK
mmetsp:Transcript_37524/g.43129  ORF Transcript_37524/g.43129 Transcript_37524/m.43129 type:complete len:110 (-) Transcript_37524:7-336(-)